MGCDGCDPSGAIRVEVLSVAEDGRPQSVRITPPGGVPFEHVLTPAEWDSVVQQSFTETAAGGFEARAAVKGLGFGIEHDVLRGQPTPDGALIEIRSAAGGPPVHTEIVCGGWCIGAIIAILAAATCATLNTRAMDHCLQHCADDCAKTGVPLDSCHYEGFCGETTVCDPKCQPLCKGPGCPDPGPDA